MTHCDLEPIDQSDAADPDLGNLALKAQTGEIESGQFAELARRLSHDERALSEYVRLTSDSIAISRLTGEVFGNSDQPPSRDGARASIADGALRRRRGNWHATLAACAATALLTFGAVRLWDRDVPDGTASQNRGVGTGAAAAGSALLDVGDSEIVYVAALTGAVECLWASHLQPPQYGEPLRAGRQLQLDAGLAQLTFNSGAKLILQGPTTFEVVSENKGQLVVGKLTALVPPPAIGFSVHTPHAEVIDLGTEFGVDVASDGNTEVHVFTGEVVCLSELREGADASETTRLLEDESASFGVDVTGVVHGRAESGKFVRQITPRLTRRELPPLPITDELALWLAADVMVKIDDADNVIAWRDLIVGDNQTEEDAWQHTVVHRPHFVRGAFGDKPAIRFDGESSYLVTTPLTTTDSQTIHLVFSRFDAPTPPGTMRQLLNYNGPPFHLATANQTIRVLQIDDSQEQGVFWARVFAGVGEGRIYNLASNQARNPVRPGEPIVLTYVYDAEGDRSELRIDGEIQSRSEAPRWKSITSRKVLGRHPQQDAFFAGDMSEVIIYNTALEDRELRAVEAYLLDKYHVQSVNTGTQAPTSPENR